MLSFGSRPSRQENLFLTDDLSQIENLGFCSLNAFLFYCRKNAGFALAGTAKNHQCTHQGGFLPEESSVR